jgi:hypothetical protein
LKTGAGLIWGRISMRGSRVDANGNGCSRPEAALNTSPLPDATHPYNTNIKIAATTGAAKINPGTTKRHGADTAGREGQPSRMNEKITPRPACHSRFQNSPALT